MHGEHNRCSPGSNNNPSHANEKTIRLVAILIGCIALLQSNKCFKKKEKKKKRMNKYMLTPYGAQPKYEYPVVCPVTRYRCITACRGTDGQENICSNTLLRALHGSSV